MIKFKPMNTPTFFTADLHLGHDAIRRHCQRPFADTDEMNRAITANWNSVVPKKALVYILGDFAWSNHRQHLARLNGSKILIMGNHDKMDQVSLSQFAEVHKLLDRRFDGHDVTLCHYKMQSYRNSFHGAWHLFGHSHCRMLPGPLSFDIGVDAWNFFPVPWEVVQKKMLYKASLIRKKNDDGEAEATARTTKQENLQYIKA